MLTAAMAASPTEDTMEEESTLMIMMQKESMIRVISMLAICRRVKCSELKASSSQRESFGIITDHSGCKINAQKCIQYMPFHSFLQSGTHKRMSRKKKFLVRFCLKRGWRAMDDSIHKKNAQSLTDQAFSYWWD